MADSFGVVVHGFNDAVINSKIKVSEDSFLMASEHPGKLSEGFETAIRPPTFLRATHKQARTSASDTLLPRPCS
jgi:hypothetical protein